MAASFILVLSFAQCKKESSGLPEMVDFNHHIRPILTQNCYTCHGPDSSSRKANLRLDIREGATMKLASGNRAIVPGHPRRSSILQRITSDDQMLIMPPPESKKQLTPYQIELITKWIDQGAEWKKHWALVPPTLREGQESTIDDFIEASLKLQKLHQNDKADHHTLIRRISYVLTGLPPSLSELEKFEQAALNEIIDYYLSSPHFGEHWARHWMDLVRYAETMGHEFDYEIGGAWRYRDYLIRAFNQDLPYSQLVKEHLAGDVITAPRLHPSEKFNESIIGTAYVFLGEGKHSPVDIKQEEADRMDNIIDVTSKTFQGLTVSCARCHDHKFDPIPTTDYYAMYGMFESARASPVGFDRVDEIKSITPEIEQINHKLKDEILKFVEKYSPQDQWVSSNVLGDFRDSDFDGWIPSGFAFGEKPMFGKFASSRYFSSGVKGVLRSPNFIIQDSFIYAYATGLKSSIRIIVDNFQLIQDPLYGSLSKTLNDESWKLYQMDVSNLIGHKAYVEILPGTYERHAYNIDSTSYIEVQSVFSTNNRIESPEEYKNSIVLDAQAITLLEKKAALCDKINEPSFIMGLQVGEKIFSPIFIRGSHKQLSVEKVPHEFHSAIDLNNFETENYSNSRLAWVEAVLHPDNPLTSRVMVNRIWHHIFGRGIVSTVDNFGLQGSLPSHPELLDYLAIKFVEEGWSIKKMIRQILRSEVFQLSTKVTEHNANIDPENIYLASFPLRRLEAESIRDALLASSGELDRQLYGPSIPVHVTEFMNGRGRPESGPLNGKGRRSIYVSIKRNFLSPMMLTFDMPIPFSTFGKRNTTNVPAQSLIMMNDPFVHEQATKWAEKLVARTDLTINDKIELVYLNAYSRVPSQNEIEEATVILNEYADERSVTKWKNYCHIIFNTKEFIHLQ